MDCRQRGILTLTVWLSTLFPLWPDFLELASAIVGASLIYGADNEVPLRESP